MEISLFRVFCSLSRRSMNWVSRVIDKGVNVNRMVRFSVQMDMRCTFLISCVILNNIGLSSSSTLDQTVARLRQRYHKERIDAPSAPISDSEDTHRKAQTLVDQWSQYEKTAGGTGFHMERPDTGPGYGPGMGDIAVRTGLGVAYPFGGFTYRRDFELGMGGSGRIGGREVGWGNGMPGLSSSPWIG